MPRKNPLGRIKDTALETLKHPRGAAEKAVGQARGTVAIGRMVADQVTSKATGVVISRLPGRQATHPTTEASQPTPAPEAKAPEVKAPAPRTAETPAPTKTAETSIDAAADVTEVEVTPADVARSVAKKAPAKKAPGKKAATRKPTPSNTPGAKLPPRKPAAKKAPSKKAATTAPAKAAARKPQSPA